MRQAAPNVVHSQWSRNLKTGKSMVYLIPYLCESVPNVRSGASFSISSFRYIVYVSFANDRIYCFLFFFLCCLHEHIFNVPIFMFLLNGYHKRTNSPIERRTKTKKATAFPLLHSLVFICFFEIQCKVVKN